MDIDKNGQYNPSDSIEIFIKIFSVSVLIIFSVSAIFYFLAGMLRDKSATEKYVDGKNGFEMAYPSGWKNSAKDLSEKEVLISFTSERDRALINIFLSRENTEEKFSLDDLKYSFRYDVMNSSENPNFEFLSEEKIIVNGLDAYLIGFNNTIKEEKIRGISLLYIKGKNVFLVSAMAADSDWPDYESLFDKCLKSIN